MYISYIMARRDLDPRPGGRVWDTVYDKGRQGQGISSIIQAYLYETLVDSRMLDMYASNKVSNTQHPD